jgi:hypothetical protein
VKKLAEQVPEVLNRVTDKVLNYRPKDKQPKPPKPTKKKRKQNENDPATLR